MQLVYVHRFSSATNVSRVVARVAEGGFYFNPSSNVAFNVTAIVRRADLHMLFQLLRVLQRIRQGWNGHCLIQLMCYPSKFVPGRMSSPTRLRFPSAPAPAHPCPSPWTPSASKLPPWKTQPVYCSLCPSPTTTCRWLALGGPRGSSPTKRIVNRRCSSPHLLFRYCPAQQLKGYLLSSVAASPSPAPVSQRISPVFAPLNFGCVQIDVQIVPGRLFGDFTTFISDTSALRVGLPEPIGRLLIRIARIRCP